MVEKRKSDIAFLSPTRNVAIGNNALFVNGSAGKEELKNPGKLADTKPVMDNVNMGVAYWGSANTLPKDMIADIETTGVLYGAIDAKARMTYGRGAVPAIVKGFNDDGSEQLEFINDTHIMRWLKWNNNLDYNIGTLKDLYGLGNSGAKLLFNPSRTELLHYKRVDGCSWRLGVTENGDVNQLLISSDWDMYTNKESDKKYFDSIPLLNREFPLFDLKSRKSGNLFGLVTQYTLTGRDFYAPSPWYAARQWVKIAQGVPTKKEAIYKNQMSIKYVVSIHRDFWPHQYPEWGSLDDKGKDALMDSFYKSVDKHLTGGENAGKSIWNTRIHDTETQKEVDAIQITVIDDKMKEGQLLPDSNAAVIEILIAMHFNPSLFGAEFGSNDAYGGGAGSGSNIRESYLVQLMLVEYERQKMSLVFDIAAEVNGWAKNYENKGMLVLRYPNQILTTLNTGAATKNIT